MATGNSTNTQGAKSEFLSSIFRAASLGAMVSLITGATLPFALQTAASETLVVGGKVSRCEVTGPLARHMYGLRLAVPESAVTVKNCAPV